MPTVIVPNSLSEELYKRIDAQLALHPDLAGERETIFSQLLEHFDRTGQVPDFKIERKRDYAQELKDAVAAKPAWMADPES